MRKISVSLAALAVMACAMLSTSFAEITTTFGGDVLWRWQLDYVKNYDADGEVTTKTGDFTNRYWWNLKMAVAANENLAFNVRLSNPKGYMTDNASTNLFRAGFSKVSNFLSVPEFCFKWQYNIISLRGGIIAVGMPPVTNTTLDLVAFETKEVGDTATANAGYANAGIMPWFVATNGSQMGLDVAVSLVSTDMLSMGIDVMGAVASDMGPADAPDAIKRDQLRILAMIPIDLMQKKVSIIPTMHLRTNVYRSADLEEGNNSMAGGADVSIKPIPQFSAKAGFAAGGYRNDALEGSATYAASAPLGMLVNAGVAVTPGFGKAIVDFALGTWKDREQTPDVITNKLLYWDLIYDMPVKTLVFRPRLRIWKWGNSDTDAGKLMLRPELDFIAKF